MPDTTTESEEKVEADKKEGQEPPQAGPPPFQPPPLNMSWANAPTERPPRPTNLGEDGFTLAKADFGS